MTKIDIFSGFLGAGKTTLIKKLISEAYAGEQLVLIENEFGEIGIDGGFMKEAGITVNELNSGCICCSLVGDFAEALNKVVATYHPDRILIEPSGVGKLSDIIRAVKEANVEGAALNSCTTVVDAGKCKMYMKNFGEFFNDQVTYANAILLSRSDNCSEEKLSECVTMLREHNAEAAIVTTGWDHITGAQILAAMEGDNDLKEELAALASETEEHHHHHHHYDENGVCSCGHHHDDDDDDDDHECECHRHHHDDDDDHECECHHHHHDDDDDECECHHHHHDDDDDDDEHEHHHDEDGHCSCGHHHHHHHGHDADEVFTSWGIETAHKFTVAELSEKLAALEDTDTYGMILRAKGIVDGVDGQWIHFDYVPGESNVRIGSAEVTGRVCVIGSHIREDAIAALFGK